MSGIVALLHHDGAPIDRELLERMTAAQRYRGPDGEGTWLDGAVGLGHTLHKTTVEAEREVQPDSLDGRFFITADARIDARDELCDGLRARGIEARTDATDCELILKAYAAWGEACVEHLLGDFSFALWDADKRKLVCAVDHLGVKPFYYANRGGLFAGSNDLECLRMHSEVRNDLNEIAVGDFLMFGAYEDRSLTIYQDILRIPPGHYLVSERGALRMQQYFTLPEPEEVHWPNEDQCIEAFEELLVKAVADRLRTPRVAIYMSGGVDSPLIASIAKRELAKRFGNPVLQAFTVVYDHLIPDDERYYANLAAESLGIPIDVEALDDDQLYDWSARFSPPQPSEEALGLSQRQQARLVESFSTVLTGYDGDALLLATVRLHWLDRARERRFGPLVRELAWYVRHERALPPVGVRTFLARLRTGLAAKPARPSWLRDGFCARTRIDERWRTSLARPHPNRGRDLSSLNFHSSAWGGLFDGCDPAFSGAAIDLRHPLADLRIVRFAFGLPAVPWCVDKWLLRRCLRGFPRVLVERPKTPLQGDTTVARFQASGLTGVGRAWQTAELAPYLDLEAVEASLGSRALGAEDLYMSLRAVGLGHWLRARAECRIGFPAPSC